MTTDLRTHPVYPELVRRYREARQVWRSEPGVRHVADLRGLTERQYCEQYIKAWYPEGLTWSSASTSDPMVTQAHMGLAWEDSEQS